MALVARGAAVALCLGVLIIVAWPQGAPAANRPIVTAVNVRGNVRVPTDKIFALIRVSPGMPLETKAVAADAGAIQTLGFFSDVKTDIRSTPGGVAITYIVIENPVVSKIVYTGNASVTGDTLTALMDTTPGNVLNTNTLKDDVEKINSYYDRLGYTGIRHVQNIKIDPDGTLHIDVKEGVTITAIDVTGNVVVRTAAILGSMKMKPGSTFSEQQLATDLQSVQSLYKDLGLSAVVDGNADPNKPGVVHVHLCEAHVGAVEIAGNAKTKDYVVRRLLHEHPGALITDAGLRRDYEALNNTQFFKSVDLSTKPFEDKCGFVTLVWTVVEQRTGTAGVGVSYGGGGQFGTGVSGNLNFSESNVGGTGNAASVSLQRGRHVSDLSLSVSVPYIHKFRPDSVSFSFFNNVISDQPYPVYKEAGNNPFFTVSPSGGALASPFFGTAGAMAGPCTPGPTPCSGIFADYSARQAGIAVSFGHPVAEFTRLSLGVQATRLSQAFRADGFPQSLLDLSGALLAPTQTAAGGAVQTGAFNVRSLTGGLARDTRDDFQNPRHGGTTSLSDEVSARLLGSDFRFNKADFDLTRFLPVRHHSTLAFHVNYGFSTGGRTLPYNDLFSLSDQQLRATKFVFYGDRELLGQVEVRVPVTADRKFGLAFFAETGDAPYITPVQGPTPAPTPTPPAGPHGPPAPPLPLNVHFKEAPFAFKSDFGFGIRVATPILPQVIRIDYATGKGGSHVSFGIGQAF